VTVKRRSSTTSEKRVLTPFSGREIRGLLSYRLHVVANLLSRGAELRYRREFGVSLWEWRSVALLGGAAAPLSLGELARSAGVDKSQMSRVVSGLSRRGLVLREADAADGRGVRLALSARGRKLYEGLIDAAAERNHAFLGCLSAAERKTLDAALAKLAGRARRMIQDEKGIE
jgi:DNA-binding MarR family transcriptional regulator